MLLVFGRRTRLRHSTANPVIKYTRPSRKLDRNIIPHIVDARSYRKNKITATCHTLYHIVPREQAVQQPAITSCIVKVSLLIEMVRSSQGPVPVAVEVHSCGFSMLSTRENLVHTDRGDVGRL